MLNIIPYPNKITEIDGTPFVLSNGMTIQSQPELTVAIDDFCLYMSKTFKYEFNFDVQNGNITFNLNNKLDKEGYILKITGDSIEIEYSAFAGALYGLQTLKQLALTCNLELPQLIIEDSPAHNRRGFMFDSGRYFFKTEDIYKFIDILVLHKLNVFHWHLTEDQGWRIQIDKYPLLTQKGSKRTHTNFNCIKHGGFYTKDEIRAIVGYCNARNIIVIPEFDIPGHTQSAIACYPYLSCFNRKLPVATHWGVKHDILCAGKDSTYQFVYDVLDEMMELFPDKIIHLGGDEAVKTRWKLCPNCQKTITNLGLKDENQLQAHFLNTIAAYLKSKGYKAVMWNEYDFSDMCDTDIIWQIWNADKRIMDRMELETNNGRKFINNNSEPYYLDLPYNTNSLKRIYNYTGIIDNVTENSCLGLEASLWTEYVPNMKKAMFMTFPRLGAFCETSWTNLENKSYDSFVLRLPAYTTFLDSNGISHYASLKRSNPNKLRGKIERAWFGKRIFAWAGLHNEIDNLKVKIRYGKKGK